MRLRNKKSGKVIKLEVQHIAGKSYESLADINKDWEDYNELKDSGYWYISDLGKVEFSSEWLDKLGGTPNNILIRKIIGNYFNIEEEAEKAVEKLKAWKRLKEANIDSKLTYEYDDFTETMYANISFSVNSYPLVGKDLDLLFGDEA